MAFEDLSQVALIGEATRSGDLSQRYLPLFEQKLCSFHTLAQDKLVRTDSRCEAEETGKIIWAKAGLPSQFLKGEMLVKMSLNEIDHLSHLLRRQLTFRFLN